jgi:hypothetical protein
MDFFGTDSVFIKNGTTGNWPARLNARYNAIIKKNGDVIQGKRVLDVGCHDGRWMHALLSAGAKHVTGVEGRAAFSEKCATNLLRLGHAHDGFDILTENVAKDGNWCSRSYDTAFVLGILYHVHSPIDLLRRVAETGPMTIIVDTAISLDPYPSLRMYLKPSNAPGHGISDTGEEDEMLVLHPSRSAVELVLTHLGYIVEVDKVGAEHLEGGVSVGNTTLPLLSQSNPLGDYILGKRLIFIARRRQGNDAVIGCF